MARGFASMSEEKRREIASAGGRAAHAKGVARKWDSEGARDAAHKSAEVRSAAAKKEPR